MGEQDNGVLHGKLEAYIQGGLFFDAVCSEDWPKYKVGEVR